MTKLPMPWRPFLDLFQGMTLPSPIFILIIILISPAILVLCAAHWISLLLCYTPRFPKIIREAGLSGKPVPKLSTIDDYPPEVAKALKENSWRWMPKEEGEVAEGDTAETVTAETLTAKSEAAAEMKKKAIGNERSEFGVGFKIEEK
jgi:hypothetical protein